MELVRCHHGFCGGGLRHDAEADAPGGPPGPDGWNYRPRPERRPQGCVTWSTSSAIIGCWRRRKAKGTASGAPPIRCVESPHHQPLHRAQTGQAGRKEKNRSGFRPRHEKAASRCAVAISASVRGRMFDTCDIYCSGIAPATRLCAEPVRISRRLPASSTAPAYPSDWNALQRRERMPTVISAIVCAARATARVVRESNLQSSCSPGS